MVRTHPNLKSRAFVSSNMYEVHTVCRTTSKTRSLALDELQGWLGKPNGKLRNKRLQSSTGSVAKSMISTVYFGVFGRKSSLQLARFQAPPSNNYPRPLPGALPILTHLKCHWHTHLLQTMGFQSYTTVPKLSILQWPPASHETAQISEPGLQGS